jgi:hypothetical protein
MDLHMGLSSALPVRAGAFIDTSAAGHRPVGGRLAFQ